MAFNTRKYRQALDVAAADKAFVSAYPKFRLMLNANLYNRLNERGYSWNQRKQVWEPRQEVVLRGERAISERLTITRPVNGTFLLRIVAPAETVSQIDAELSELAEAIGWQIEPGSRLYENEPDGKWVRKYYTVRRG